LTTKDSGIVATFEQECAARPNDQRLILAKLECVSWIEEILELNYGVLNIIMFLYNWVKVNYTRNNATIKIDEYNFTLVNFNSLIPISFAFPIHVEQVFFSIDPKEKGWKVVLRKYPRGKQITRDVNFDLIDLDMFRIENDDSYTNLQAPISILEVTQITTIVGGVPLVPIGLVNVIVGTNQDNHDNDPQSANEFDGPNNFDNDG